MPETREAGITVLTGGTDVHLVLVDLRDSELDGKQAEDRLHEVGITVNRNAVPFDPRPPMVTSGLRIGTPALATRGFGDAEFAEVADVIAAALQARLDDVETSCAPASPRWPKRSRSTRGRPDDRTPGDLPEHPDFLWDNPEPKKLLRRDHRGRRRARPRHRVLPGQGCTASPTSPCWRRAGSRAATWPATPRSSAPTTSGTRAPASTSTPSSCGKASKRTSTTRSCSASAAC